MCGIAGIVSPGMPLTGPLIPTMLRRLERRGPDDLGWLVFTADGVQLGDRPVCHPTGEVMLLSRRLSILDLSPAGHQPMQTADGRYFIVFNGEIYNERELREELAAVGHTFRSHSDTEVLLAAYAEWGPAALPRLIGMFALAILDTRARTLFLARDYFGIKPLYYSLRDGVFAFASEIKALLDLPTVGRRVNPERLYHYLRFGITDHGDATLFADIRQVPAAHYLLVPIDRPADAHTTRYWTLSTGERCDLSFAEAARTLRDLFVRSVALHLRSDVPVGLALSGGIDSSAIAMVARELQGPAQPLHAFSYIADQPDLNEECWVDLVARAADLDIHKVRVRPEELVADLDQLIDAHDEPFVNTRMYAQYRVYRAAHAAGLKVMLIGQGADEMFAGYRAYLSARIASLVHRGRWREALRFWWWSSTPADIDRLWLLAETGGLLLPLPVQGPARQVLGQGLLPGWLNAEWFLRRGVTPRPFRRPGRGDALRGLLYRSFVETSLPQYLRYEDRNSMAFSVESRVPFLMPALVQFVFSLPESYIVDGNGVSKAVFRRALRGLVPDAVLDRRDKIGFSTPERAWLTTLYPWVNEVLAGATAASIPVLNLPAVRHCWQEVLRGRRPFAPQVWRWLNVIRWAERYRVCFA
jgi:asparagine synthase (glutamine-hydrolysing)